MAYSTGTIAAGCFGKVYKEKYDDTWAAVKKVPLHLINRKDLERECEVYRKCTHPHIVKLLGNIIVKDSKWIIPLEFIFGEDLETTIFTAAKSKIQLTRANRATIIIGMCEGLLHLHSKDVVHQDLKPDNIMVEHGTNRAVIIDLGLAKFFRGGLNSAMNMGNDAYSAPEVLSKFGQRDQRSDVWAMGKIIAELCARIRLYTPSVCPEKIKETLRGQPHCQAVCRMVESDPAQRASMLGVMSDIRRAGGGFNVGRAQAGHLHPTARNRSPSPMHKSPSPSRFHQSPSPQRWERAPSPKPEPAALRPQAPVQCPPSPRLREDRNKDQALVARNTSGLSDDFMKMTLYREAAKDVPHGLPTTGVVRVRRFEEKDGKVEMWEQKEVVMQGGKIIKYNDIRFNK